MTFIQQVADSAGWSGAARPVQDAPGSASADNTGTTDPTGLGQSGSRVLAHNRRVALLNRMVEAEILPRLAMVRGGATASQAKDTATVTTADDTTELVRLLLGRDEDGAGIFVEVLERRGVTPASLYLGVVTQAARRLGELWEEDRCDFAQVTISLGRLQHIVRVLSPTFQKQALMRSAHSEAVLLLPAPGEQHTIGLVILGEFFQREGWNVLGGPMSTGYDAAGLVRSDWVDIAGFSIGSASRLAGLTATIRAARIASRNPDLGIMVGGPLFLKHPELVARVGADTTAPDAPGALRQARTLLSMRAATS